MEWKARAHNFSPDLQSLLNVLCIHSLGFVEGESDKITLPADGHECACHMKALNTI